MIGMMSAPTQMCGRCLAETTGKVHRGFKAEVDDLWPMLETALMDNDLPLYFCGHSLGGAMSTICAGRCYLSHINSNPRELFTYGSPRVGDKRYINYVKLDHYRYVNNNDIVARVPPAFMGYRHCGSEVYVNRHGEIQKLGLIMKRRDRWRGFFRGLWKAKDRPFCRPFDSSLHRSDLPRGGARGRGDSSWPAQLPSLRIWRTFPHSR